MPEDLKLLPGVVRLAVRMTDCDSVDIGSNPIPHLANEITIKNYVPLAQLVRAVNQCLFNAMWPHCIDCEISYLTESEY